MKVLLNELEDAALAGLAYAVICLYVRALRPRMNYVTGMVGVTPFLSWQALAEWLYVEPARGIKGGSPSRWAVMRMAGQLEAAGLLRKCSNVCNAQLIFQLPLATLYSHAQKKAATKPQPLPATPPSGNLHSAGAARQAAKAARGENAKAAIHLSTPVPPSNKPYYHREDSYTGLIWPNGLTPIESRAILALLEKSKLNGTAQLVLDELEGGMIIKSVFNKVAYARVLIEKAQRGELTLEKAHIAVNAREQRAATNLARQAATDAPIKKSDLARGRAALKEIRSKIRKGAQLK